MDEKLFEQAAAALPKICFEKPPACGLILGSGWSQTLQTGTVLARLSYADIPGLGAGTIAGHSGEMVLFERHGLRIVAFMGRRHYYEGVPLETVVLPVELMRRMGVTRLLVTNAAGGINSQLQPGSLMVIRDHINLTGITPLRGQVLPGWGPRFPDQSQLYSPELSNLLRHAGLDVGAVLAEGIYVYSTGPGFETPAEIRAYSGMGADAVGMSTVHEVVAANAIGMKIVALSCITNMAAGISGPHLSHQEVIEQTEKSAPVMSAVLDAFLRRLASL
jgi:purine-nucleoside phosphorylase